MPPQEQAAAKELALEEEPVFVEINGSQVKGLDIVGGEHHFT